MPQRWYAPARMPPLRMLRARAVAAAGGRPITLITQYGGAAADGVEVSQVTRRKSWLPTRYRDIDPVFHRHHQAAGS